MQELSISLPLQFSRTIILNELSTGSSPTRRKRKATPFQTWPTQSPMTTPSQTPTPTATLRCLQTETCQAPESKTDRDVSWLTLTWPVVDLCLKVPSDLGVSARSGLFIENFNENHFGYWPSSLLRLLLGLLSLTSVFALFFEKHNVKTDKYWLKYLFGFLALVWFRQHLWKTFVHL